MSGLNKLAVGILASGSGTNLKAILEACASGRTNARVAVVVSDKKDAYALTRARDNGVPAIFIDPKKFPDRTAFNKEIAKVLKAHKIGLLCMAGYMRLLGKEVLDSFPGKVMNIHPSLLPSFKGAHAVRDALQFGARVTGVTVHFADGTFDTGPIILQKAVEILDEDTEDLLLERIHQAEYELYPEAIELFARDVLAVEGRRVRILPGRGQLEI